MKKEVIKGLDQTKIDGGKPRLTGITTRLLDQYIQDLFITGTAVVKSEWSNEYANAKMADCFRQRLRMEHGSVYFFSDVTIKETKGRESIYTFQLVHQEEDEVLQDDFDMKIVPTGPGIMSIIDDKSIPYTAVTDQEYIDIIEQRNVEMNEDTEPPFTKDARDYNEGDTSLG